MMFISRLQRYDSLLAIPGACAPGYYISRRWRSTVKTGLQFRLSIQPLCSFVSSVGSFPSNQSGILIAHTAE